MIAIHYDTSRAIKRCMALCMAWQDATTGKYEKIIEGKCWSNDKMPGEWVSVGETENYLALYYEVWSLFQR